MRFAEESPITNADTPEARRYNRIHRWLEFSDFALGLAFLLVLLLSGWNAVLRDWAYRAAFQNYTVAVFFYVFILMLGGKLLGIGLDYYGLRLERNFHLSNQKTRSWLWDEIKGFLVGLVVRRHHCRTPLLHASGNLPSTGGSFPGPCSWDCS